MNIKCIGCGATIQTENTLVWNHLVTFSAFHFFLQNYHPIQSLIKINFFDYFQMNLIFDFSTHFLSQAK